MHLIHALAASPATWLNSTARPFIGMNHADKFNRMDGTAVAHQRILVCLCPHPPHPTLWADVRPHARDTRRHFRENRLLEIHRLDRPSKRSAGARRDASTHPGRGTTP